MFRAAFGSTCLRGTAIAFLFVPGLCRSALAQDTRKDVEVGLFTGISVDSFAAKELRQYLNKEDSSEVREQLVAGFDFSYRLAGNAKSPRQFWLYGETIHGVRSGDVNCTGDNQDTELCKIARLEATDQSAPLAIFRKATSFEAFIGLRAELLRLRAGAADPAEAASMLYLKGQLGLLTVAGRGGDVVDMHHGAIGITLTQGSFAHSYVEIGYGRNELFLANPRRWKIDGFLSMGPDDKAVRPFAQIVIDADFGDGADSIQSFFGLDVDVRDVWK
jgi:hypothetical protein